MASDGSVFRLPVPVGPEEGQGDGRGDERSEHTVRLRNGRTLRVAPGPEGETDRDQIVELRAASGDVELRIRMTEDGPVLCVDGLRLSITAADEIALRCNAFAVEAAESVAISSRGGIELAAEQEIGVRSTDDVRVRGRLIFLN